MKTGDSRGYSVEDWHTAHAEDQFRTAANLLVGAGVVAASAVDHKKMQQAIALAAAEALDGDRNSKLANSEIVAGVEYTAARAQLEKTFDDIWAGESVTLPSHQVGFSADVRKEFERNPRIISILQVQNKVSGLLGTTLVEALADDGSRTLEIRNLSNYRGDSDEWTSGDYTVGPTEGKAREQFYGKDPASGRTTTSPPTVRSLTGEDITNLATRLINYQLVQGGQLHRVSPTS